MMPYYLGTLAKNGTSVAIMSFKIYTMENKYTNLQIKRKHEKDPFYVVHSLEMFDLVVGVLTAKPKE